MRVMVRNWPKHPAGHQPAGPEGQHRHYRESDSRVHKKLMRVGGALGGLDGPGLRDLMYGSGELIHRQREPVLVVAPIVAGPGSAVSPNGFRAREVTTAWGSPCP